MPMFLRKALRVGPLRFNLSKSGIGVSAGVPGLRVGLIGPRGHYIYAGRNGLYYRKTLNGSPRATPSQPSPSAPTAPPAQYLDDVSEPVLQDVTGATVMAMAASSPGDLVNQLNESAKIQSLWGWAAGLGGFATVIAFGAFWPAGIPLLIGTVVLAWWLRQRDMARKAVVAFYDVNDEYAQRFETLIQGFGWVQASQRNRRMVAIGSTDPGYQRKVHAGATSLETVLPVVAGIGGPKQLTTNVSVPSLEDTRSSIYFLPDKVLICSGSAFAELDYGHLGVEAGQTRWIEEESVPGDTRQVDTTWKYVNKSGGPDRRFKDNRQLPIILLSTLRLSGPNGLDARYDLSNPDSAGYFAQALNGMKAAPNQPPLGC
jgi:hypothetical protein